MSEVKSSLGQKSYAAGGRKVLTISDDSWEDNTPLPEQPKFQPSQEVKLSAEQFNEMQRKKQEYVAAKNKPSPEAKLRVSVLCDIDRLSTEVEAGGYKFTLRSLKSREMKEVMKLVSGVTIAAEAMYEMRAQILARALVSVDDKEMGLILGTDNLDEVLEFVNELQESFVNKLYTGYTKMIKENDEKFAVKDAADAQAVADEIKKS